MEKLAQTTISGSVSFFKCDGMEDIYYHLFVLFLFFGLAVLVDGGAIFMLFTSKWLSGKVLTSHLKCDAPRERREKKLLKIEQEGLWPW